MKLPKQLQKKKKSVPNFSKETKLEIIYLKDFGEAIKENVLKLIDSYSSLKKTFSLKDIEKLKSFALNGMWNETSYTFRDNEGIEGFSVEFFSQTPFKYENKARNNRENQELNPVDLTPISIKDVNKKARDAVYETLYLIYGKSKKYRDRLEKFNKSIVDKTILNFQNKQIGFSLWPDGILYVFLYFLPKDCTLREEFEIIDRLKYEDREGLTPDLLEKLRSFDPMYK